VDITTYTLRTIATYRATSRQLRRLSSKPRSQMTWIERLRYEARAKVCADAWRVLAYTAPLALRWLLAEDATLVAIGERKRQGLPVDEQLAALREIRTGLAPFTQTAPLDEQFARAFAAGFRPALPVAEVARVA